MDLLTRTDRPAAAGGRRAATGRWLRGLAVASLVANIVIILTGGLVRLTDSGLGCPTWPQCTAGSYTPHPALGIHGRIEFGNRLITFVLIIIALATWIVALLHRRADGRPDRRLRWLTFGLGLGIPFQGVIGGITVLTHLNPYLVSLHMLDSLVLVALATWLVRLTWHRPAREVAPGIRVLTVVTAALAWLVVCIGTVLTGSGPHAGALGAHRTGLNPSTVSHVHSGVVYLLVAATLAAVLLLRTRAAAALLAVEVAQAVVGFVQYYSNLPIGLVTVHLLGAALTVALSSNLAYSVRRRRPADVPPGSDPAAGADPGLRPATAPAARRSATADS